MTRQTLRTSARGVRSDAALDDHILSQHQHTEPDRTVDLMRFINELSQKRMRQILILRFGLGDNRKPLSLAKTSSQLGLSKQWVYLLEQRALRALRMVLARAPSEIRERTQEICGLKELTG